MSRYKPKDIIPDELTYTSETRLQVRPGQAHEEFRNYIDSFLPEYSRILMFAFVNLSRPENRRKWKSDAALNTEICHRFGVLKRTANSAIRDAKGRIRALLELKKTELVSLEEKIKKQKQQIKIREVTRDELKPIARTNSLNEEAKIYRNVRASLYHRKNRLNQLNQQAQKLKREIDEVDLHMCFGTKKLFKAQYHLEENHIPSHEAWKKRFVKNRDKNLYYLGSADEVMGNGLFQLRYDEKEDEFTARVRIQNDFKEDAFLTVEHLDFKRRRSELIEIVKRLAELPRSSKQRQPLSFRIKRRGNKYYLQVIFTLPKKPVLTRSSYGVIGLDYNNGFIEAAETNEDGNLVDLRHYPLEFHGTGNRAASELQSTVHEIVRYALERGKDVVIEDLDFKRKKAECKRAKSAAGKRYNRMIHAFDYGRYGECMERACFSGGVHLMSVSPAYTSRIGKQKYQDSKKLTVHQAAAYVIARRGQMFSDELIKK